MSCLILLRDDDDDDDMMMCILVYDSCVDLLCMLSNIAHTHAISSLSKSDTYIGATMNPNLVRIWSVV